LTSEPGDGFKVNDAGVIAAASGPLGVVPPDGQLIVERVVEKVESDQPTNYLILTKSNYN
jgi:hypothetical protein